MNIVYLHRGIPRTTDGSIRSWRSLSWLATRHVVTLVDVAAKNRRAHELDLPTGLHSVRRLPVHTPSPLGWRLAPWAEIRVLCPVPAETLSLVANADWVWIGWWPLAVWTDAFRRANPRSFVTWDWDALSVRSSSLRQSLGSSRPFAAFSVLPRTLLDAAFERTYLPRVDVATVPSERDQRALLAEGVPAKLIRNCVSVASYEEVRKRSPSASGRTVLFVGTDYGPNVDGLKWFVSEVWLGVRSRFPDARLRLIGRGLDRVFRSVPRTGLESIGTVDDIRTEMQNARVIVCPIFHGAGIPNKVLEAAAGGRPTLITPHCAEAVGWPNALTTCSSAHEWIAALEHVLADEEAADDLGRAAASWVSMAFDEAQWEGDMQEVETDAVRSHR